MEKLPKTPRTSVAIFLSLSPEQIARNGRIEEFESFLNEDRFPFNSECERYFVLLNKRLLFKSTIQNSKMSVLSYLEFLSQHKLLAAASIFIGIFTLPSIVQPKRIGLRTMVSDILRLVRDQVISQYIGLLRRKTYSIKYLVGTNSYLVSGLPLLFRSDSPDYERVLLWYSINSTPISKSEIAPKRYLHPDLCNFIDTHFVWNEYQKLELEAQGARRVLVKGPMVFAPTTGCKLGNRTPMKQRILFFEVAPYKELSNGFYSTRSSMLTLSSLVDLRRLLIQEGPLDPQVVVKPKRQYTKSIDPEYVDFIMGLRELQQIDLLKPDCNLYEEISRADLVLAPPFSSPCVIAREMQIPSYFFFLADDEWQLPNEKHGIKVLRDFPSLAMVAKDHLKLV